MSLFSKSSYVYLASICRDIKNSQEKDGLSWGFNCDSNTVDFCIQTLANALEKENPYGFDKKRFLDNVFYTPVNTPHVTSNQ